MGKLVGNIRDHYMRFNLTTINSLETAGLGNMLLIFAAFMGTLQILSLILQNALLPCIIVIFLKKNPLGN